MHKVLMAGCVMLLPDQVVVLSCLQKHMTCADNTLTYRGTAECMLQPGMRLAACCMHLPMLCYGAYWPACSGGYTCHADPNMRQ
jgi:hypothetical protein